MMVPKLGSQFTDQRFAESEQIAKEGPDPLYEQVKDRIIAGIRSGEWEIGERLPSELQLVKELGISKMTINRAFRELAAQGMIVRIPARGSFVAEPRERTLLFELRDFAGDIRAHGGQYGYKIVTLERMQIPQSLADYDLRENTEVFHSVIVHYRNDLAVQIEERWVNPSAFPNYLDIDLTRTSTFRHLSLVPPSEMEHEIAAVLPSETEQKLLAIDAGEPCLRLRRRTWSGRELLARSYLTSPGSRYFIENRFKVANP